MQSKMELVKQDYEGEVALREQTIKTMREELEKASGKVAKAEGQLKDKEEISDEAKTMIILYTNKLNEKVNEELALRKALN